MHVYLIETIYRSVEKRRNNLSFILEPHIFRKRMSNDDKSVPWEETIF